MLPGVSDQVDWEAELGVVIGTALRRASPGQAAAAIAGYTIVNDISMRDWQWRTSEWLQGKTFEASTPVGPWLVTPDEVDAAGWTFTATSTGTADSEGTRRTCCSRPPRSPPTSASSSPWNLAT